MPYFLTVEKFYQKSSKNFKIYIKNFNNFSLSDGQYDQYSWWSLVFSGISLKEAKEVQLS